MWSLKPLISPPSTCPGCNSENEGFAEYIFTGTHILGKGVCACCGLDYYHNWPVGHGADFPISFNLNGTARYPEKAAQWLARPLIKAVKQNLSINAPVRREVKKSISQALLLNCLDPCYGHVIWKLFNASRYRDIPLPGGLVVLIPANCSWLVPGFVAEIWSVDANLSSLNYLVPSVGTFIRETSRNFESVSLVPVATHMDHSGVDIQQFLPVKPFRLQDFYLKPACITLIWREDRFWLASRPEQWISLVACKYSIKWLISWLSYRQLKKMSKVTRFIRREMPAIRIKVTGLGVRGKFPEYIEDLRQLKLTEYWEKKWCQVYADSQLVIGIHGSNMLIPTAIAAGFIELLPPGKIPFITEDILMKHGPRLQMFLGRHLDVYSSSKIIARHVISVFRDFEYLYRNMQQ